MLQRAVAAAMISRLLSAAALLSTGTLCWVLLRMLGLPLWAVCLAVLPLVAVVSWKSDES